jgi:hypothetical protein
MRSRLARMCGCGAALLAAVLVFESGLSAAVPVAAPENDGLTLGSGLGVLAAGYLILKAWRGSR